MLLTDPTPSLDGRRVGQYVHCVIADLVQAGERSPSPEVILCAVGRHRLTGRSVQYRQAALRQLLAATSLYFGLFGPREDWALIGTEVPALRTRFDLVWGTSTGVLADEIKIGRLGTIADREALDQQLERQLAAGTARYDDAREPRRGPCRLPRPGRRVLGPIALHTATGPGSRSVRRSGSGSCSCRCSA